VDSVPDLTTALSLMLAELGLPAHDEGTVRQIIGEGQRSLVERALLRAGAAESPQAGLADAVIDDAVLRFRRHYSDNLCVRTRLYDGVRETLHALSANFPLAVATNKPGHWARTLCEVLELSPLFRWVLGEDDVGARKPDPKLLLELCRRAAVPVERTLFVGDSRIDWQAAEAAGMDLACVPTAMAVKRCELPPSRHPPRRPAARDSAEAVRSDRTSVTRRESCFPSRS
jgi:phosphoglycolate phosphatase